MPNTNYKLLTAGPLLLLLTPPPTHPQLQGHYSINTTIKNCKMYTVNSQGKFLETMLLKMIPSKLITFKTNLLVAIKSYLSLPNNDKRQNPFVYQLPFCH
jgi:hypothetical protein